MNARGIPTAAYQVLLEVGYPPHQDTPLARSNRGVPKMGFPPLGYLLVRCHRGVPKVGFPIRVPPIGYPPARSNGVYPMWGTPGQDTPWSKRGYRKGGTPHWVLPGQVRWGGTWGGVLPCWGTPWPGLMGGTQGGVPPQEVPPRLDLAVSVTVSLLPAPATFIDCPRVCECQCVWSYSGLMFS